MRLPLPLLLSIPVAGCALAGCAAAVPEDRAAHLALGTGTWRYEPLEDGASVPMVHGAQGGWHVWLAVRAEGLEVSSGSLEIELQPADESAPPQRTALGIHFDPPDEEGARDYLGWPAILPDPSCAVGVLLRVRATFTSASGERLVAEREIVPGPGDDPPPPCGG